MARLSLANASKPIAVLWDHEEVGGGDGCDVAEGQTLVIFEDDGRGDLLPHNLVEDGDFFGYCCLSKSLFSTFGHLSFLF